MSRAKQLKRPQLTQVGFLGRFQYFARRAVVNMRVNMLVTSLTVGTITLALLIL